MAVQFINDGASIKVVDTKYTRSVQKEITKFNVVGDSISMRAGKFGDQWNFTDVTSPVTASIDALRALLESWLEASGGGSGIVIDASQLDAAGRQSVALPVVLGDYKFINDLQPEHFDTEVNGTGAIAFDGTVGAASMTTAASGDWAVMQTNQWHPYFSGKAQQPMVTYINLSAETNVEKRVGYYSSSTSTPFNTSYDGMWLRRGTDGELYFEVFRDGTENISIAQSDWDDPLDGSGASGFTLDTDNFLVTYWDFLYLGGTKSALRFIIEGTPVIAHTYKHSNLKNTTIIKNPAQPLRAEIRQTGAGSGTFKFICSQVTSNGDANQLVGFPVAVQSGITRIALNNGARIGLLKIRLKDGYRNLSVFQEIIETVTNGAAGNTYIWELRLNPTLDTGAWGAYADADKVGVEYAVGTATTVMNGDGYYISGGNGATRGTGGGKISKLRRIGTKIDGTQDELVLIMIAQDNSLAGHVIINTNVI